MNKELMFSSDSGEWDTPQELINDLAEVFNWDLDVCASRPNVCHNYYALNKGQNALVLPWDGLWWCNFPYGRGSVDWIKKGVQSVKENGGAGVFLSPSRTDTKATQYLMKNSKIVVFISGRLVFGSDQSWIDRHQKTIMKKTPVSGIKKVGGKLVSPEIAYYAGEIWDHLNLNFPYDDWLNMDYLKKDAAPFPSMFSVVGHGLTDKQVEKLASYGIVATIE